MCRFAVNVCITATSLGSAPTIGANFRAASSSTSSHGGNGESLIVLKWPCTPWEPQVVRNLPICSLVLLGWIPKEFPQR